MPYCTIESKIMMIVQGSECLGDTEEVTTDGTGEITQRMGIVQHVPQPSNYEISPYVGSYGVNITKPVLTLLRAEESSICAKLVALRQVLHNCSSIN